MATLYSEIDDFFLADINDPSFLNYEVEYRETILNMLRKKAINRFKVCKTDLYDRDEILKQFNNDLSEEIQIVIATAMRYYWQNDKINGLSLLKQKMSNSEWKLTSQANHLRELLSLHDHTKREVSEAIVDYTIHNK